MQNLLDQYLIDDEDASDSDSWDESEIYIDKYLIESSKNTDDSKYEGYFF